MDFPSDNQHYIFFFKQKMKIVSTLAAAIFIASMISSAMSAGEICVHDDVQISLFTCE